MVFIPGIMISDFVRFSITCLTLWANVWCERAFHLGKGRSMQNLVHWKDISIVNCSFILQVQSYINFKLSSYSINDPLLKEIHHGYPPKESASCREASQQVGILRTSSQLVFLEFRSYERDLPVTYPSKRGTADLLIPCIWGSFNYFHLAKEGGTYQ